MTYKSLISQFFTQHQKKLEELYPGLNERRLQRDLIDFVVKYPFERAYLEDECLGRTKKECLDFLKELLTGKPIEYITGKAFFYEFNLYVNDCVLIPRQETEILVAKALEYIHKSHYKKILDLGTGSGAIILALAKALEGEFRLFASDISLEALQIAKKNAEALEYLLSQQIEFLQSDLFSNIQDRFDLILSNPPYIKKVLDKQDVHSQVLQFEPEIALFIDDQSYESWFDGLFQGAFSRLNDQGRFMMEGHESHLENLAGQMKKVGFVSIEIQKDLSGRNRFITGEKK